MGRTSDKGSLGLHLPELLGAGVGLVAGAAVVLVGRREERDARPGSRPGRRPGARGGALAELDPSPAVHERQLYEFCARVVWSDTRGPWSCDMEDPEGVQAMVGQGWELVNVIVPFAQTNNLGFNYPGNTRKLIAYFRRPREGCAA